MVLSTWRLERKTRIADRKVTGPCHLFIDVSVARRFMAFIGDGSLSLTQCG